MSLRAMPSVVIAGLLGGLLIGTLMPAMAIADEPIASSSFVGAENPLSENGAWAAITSLAPSGTRFQKNNGAYPDRLTATDDHAGARTTAVVPADHYSEIVVGHIGSINDNVGPSVRVQASGPSIDSQYVWYASLTGGFNILYRIDANGTTFTSPSILLTSPVVDGDRLRLIARGPVIYGIKNGVRDFIYNTGYDATKYSTGTTGILAHAAGAVTDAKIASWSTGAAPVASGTWTSSTFAGTENPLDEGDRWYPLPGYSGFKKAGGAAIGRDSAHNSSGVWSIAAPAKQYSEVTLGAVASGGGGPMVRIDRSNTGETGWMLFLYADGPSASGIYKVSPGGVFTGVQLFTPTIVSGDKWRLTADGNTLEVFRNGVSQFMYTTDGSYPTGDVGIHAYTPAFTFTGWEGGDTAGGQSTNPPTAPSNLTAAAASSSQINLTWTASSGAVTSYLVERCQEPGCSNFAQVGTSTSTAFMDTGLFASKSYTYRVQASGPGGLSAYSNAASATTQAPPPPTAPSNLTAAAASSSQINLTWTASSGAVTSYLVERCQEPGCSNFAQVGTSPSASYSDTGLFASKSYTYRVRASGPGGLSAYSNAASATTANFTDVTAPTLSLPGNITTPATSFLGAIVTFKVSATDNVDPSPTVRCSPPSGSIFRIGITTVTCTATDHAGNVGSGSFLVTVLRL